MQSLLLSELAQGGAWGHARGSLLGRIQGLEQPLSADSEVPVCVPEFLLPPGDQVPGMFWCLFVCLGICRLIKCTV